MSNFHKFLVLTLLIFGSVGAFAQSMLTAPLPRMGVAQSLPAQANGRILFFAYADGRPVQGQNIILKDVGSQNVVATGTTNSDGFLSAEIKPGIYELSWHIEDSPRVIHVKSGEEIELTLVRPQAPDQQARVESRTSAPTEFLPTLISSAGTEIRIQVLEKSSGEAIESAMVRVLGFEGAVRTNDEGLVQIRVPKGQYSLLVSSTNHRIETRPLVVTDESPQSVVLDMETSGSELEEVVILAPKNKGSVASLLEMRRSTQAVAEVLGAEQMSRQGDSDAATALRRVTGLTLVGGKYVYVRGLGERYSAVQLNGLSLPSPEPSRRVVPLDLFPTGVLESVIVQKSFTPDLPAEFGGGLIQLKTRSLPEAFFARGQVSLNLEDGQERLSYAGGAGDYLGSDDGTRRMPSGIRQSLSSGSKLFELSGSTLETLGESLGDAYAVNQSREGVLPSFNFATGRQWSFGKYSVGAAASLLSSTSTEVIERQSGNFNVGAGGALERAETAKTEIGEIERKLGATLDVGTQLGENNKITLTNLFVRNTSDRAQIKEFSQSGDSFDSRRQTNLEWVQRDLHVRQIHGQHRWKTGASDRPMELNWRGGLANAFRDSPDSREYVYVQRNNVYEFNTDTTGNRRVFSELRDQSQEITTQLDLPVDLGTQKTTWKIGMNRQMKDRKSDTYRLHFKNRYASGAGPDLRLSPEELFTPKNISPDGFELTNLTESADSYQGDQALSSIFGILEWEPHSDWSFTAGLRDESSNQEVRTFFYFEPGVPTSRAGLRSRDMLPAYSATWKPNAKLRVRLAYGETVARPDFRELSTVPFIDDETGYEAVGNSRLRGTVIRNIDHRWEYYFKTDEYVSLGFFQKRFESPIEEVFEPGPNLRKTYENAKAATNRGVEFETRWGLRSIDRSLRRWSILSNLSLIESQIDIGDALSGVQTSTVRPLQGQSPYMINFFLQYDRPSEKSVATLLYNRIGARITEVGTGGRPDIYEQPFDQLDFVYGQQIANNASVQFRARNLLDPELSSTQGAEVVRSLRRGRSFNVGLTATY